MANEAFPLREKLAWLDRLLFDRELTPIVVRVGLAIVWHVNRRTGVAIISRETLATKIGACTKTIDKSIKVLEAGSYFEVRRPRQRAVGYEPASGRANVYRPLLDTSNESTPISATDRSNVVPGKGHCQEPKGRTSLPSYPCSTQSLTQDTGPTSATSVPPDLIASAVSASRTVFVAKTDDRWASLVTRWRLERNPHGVPVYTSNTHGNQTGWNFPAEWLDDLGRDAAAGHSDGMTESEAQP
ncbi:hypothetical protein [Microbaculum sp. FT89]|uniref:hypothetical protein n=1 Tax=Microbaculum sp. FT89 TaxID=3447298 RepID=UPI003F53E336